MKRLVCAALAMAFLAITAPAASAQVTLGVAGGLTIPTSDYGDYAKTGWLGHVDVGIPIGDAGVAVGASGYYGSNNHDTDGDKTNIYGALGFLAYSFDTGAPVTPTVFGMAGTLTHAYKSDTFEDDSETGFAYGGGVGLGFPLGGVTGVVRGWYVGASIGDPSSTTAVIGVDLGVQFALGGGM